jgi:phosphoglycolate phosphatase-like HAD superfamily hydrolase
MSTEPLKLVTTKPDAEMAAEFKQKLIQVYEPLLVLLDEINDAGFQAGIQTGKGGPLGKNIIQQLQVSKVY